MTQPHQENSESKKRSGTSRPTKSHDQAVKRLKDLFKDRQFAKEYQEVLREKDPHAQYVKLLDLVIAYDLDFYAVLAAVGGNLTLESPSREPDVDYCRVADQVEEILDNLSIYVRSLHAIRDLPRELHIISRTVLFPVHICVSPLATQQDIVDFVKANWTEIKRMQRSYQRKARRVRARRQVERDEFIWEQWIGRDKTDITLNELAELVNEKFPRRGNPYTYNDIRSTVRSLEKRYSGKTQT